MENYTLYSHSVGFDRIVSTFKKKFPKITPEIDEKEETKTIYALFKGGLLGKNKELRINYRERRHPSYRLTTSDCPVSAQLIGMYNFVNSITARDESIKRLLLHKIETVNSETSFTAAPSLSTDMQELLLDLTESLDAIVFANPGLSFSDSKYQHFLDKNFTLLMDSEGNTGKGVLNIRIDTKYWDDQQPASEEQLQRKAASEEMLAGRQAKVNAHLPVVAGTSTVILREPAAIIERAYCLMLMTAKGEGIQPDKLQSLRDDLSIRGLTAAEHAVYEKEELTEQDKFNALWRYESLNVLLWVLGLVEELAYPSAICDVSAVVQILVGQSRAELERKVRMRSVAVVLDELDKTYREHWACVDARINKIPPTGELSPSVVFERHYSLNWVTRYQEQEWDDVSTDT